MDGQEYAEMDSEIRRIVTKTRGILDDYEFSLLSWATGINAAPRVRTPSEDIPL